MSDYLKTADVWTVLDLIVAEFTSDPMSVQCFDLRLVARAKELNREHPPAWELLAVATRLAELLKAARAVLTEADTFHDDTAHYIEVRRSAVETLRAAIAKAEGR